MSTDTPTEKEPRVTNRELKSLIEDRLPKFHDFGEPAKLMTSEPTIPVSALASLAELMTGIAFLSTFFGLDPEKFIADALNEAMRDDSEEFDTFKGMAISLSDTASTDDIAGIRDQLVGKDVNDSAGKKIGTVTRSWIEDGDVCIESTVKKGTIPGLLTNMTHVEKPKRDATNESLIQIGVDKDKDAMYGRSPLRDPMMKWLGADIGRSDTADAMSYALQADVKPTKTQTPAQARLDAIGNRINLEVDFTKTDLEYRYSVCTEVHAQSGFMNLETLYDYMYYTILAGTVDNGQVREMVQSMVEQTEEAHYSELKSVGLEGEDGEVREFNGTWYKYVGNEVKRTYFYGNGTKHIIPAPKWLWINPDGKSHRLITSGRTTHRVTLEGCVDISWKVKKGSALSSF